MRDIETLTSLMKNLYGAEVIHAEETDNWIDDDENLLAGYRFPDKKAAFYAISAGDYELLTEDQQMVCQNLREFPFDKMIVLVYTDKKGELHMRITNGIASSLAHMFVAWKNWEN